MLLLENLDEDESGWNEVVRNAKQPNEAIQIIEKYKLLLKGENKRVMSIVDKQGELLFFSIRIFFHGHWQLTGLQGKGGDHLIPLYNFHPLTNIQTFICNFAREMTITYF